MPVFGLNVLFRKVLHNLLFHTLSTEIRSGTSWDCVF